LCTGLPAARDNDPVLFLEHKFLYKRLKGPVPEEEYTIPIGKGDIKRNGDDLTIIALGAMVQRALAAADTLGEKGVSVEVVDPRSLLPLDEGYGIPGVTVDGNDVRKVHSEAQKAIKRAREGKGPTLLECLVHRWTGHSISDADVYRSERERKEGERNDPVLRCRKKLISEGILTEQEYDKIEKHVESEIEDAVQYSETQCTDPDPLDILRGVYGS